MHSSHTIIPRKATRNAVIAIAWIVCLAFASFAPDSWKANLGTKGWLHLPLHFVVFAVAGMLAYRSARSAAARIMTCASIAALALLLEMLQSRRFAHEMEWPDVLVDIAGLLFAMVFYCP
jgi:uncharacterized protein YfiM (DUF2279 family)